MGTVFGVTVMLSAPYGIREASLKIGAENPVEAYVPEDWSVCVCM